ncbi:hypothetical protein [Saccharothrix deserti]|uniref:hypothetical protein n=1 Tax=Saccharothrix deserti TaxID=2593674 RepID=UPI00131CDF3F|nr:hypothetical protein [Saccharothrix deserti]
MRIPSQVTRCRRGTALRVHRDAATPNSGTLLVLHHHNATGDRTDLVKVRES